MTQNQIAFRNAKELERHNIMSEQENKRHAMQEEALKKRSNELTEQSNTITREHYERMDAINSQHYANQDTLNALIAEENRRANLAGEAIREQQNAINAAGVAEQRRHALVSEGIESSLAASTIQKQAAEVSYATANTGLVQAKTATEQVQPQYVLNQSELVRRQGESESYRPENIQSNTWRNYIDSISDVLGWTGQIVPFLKVLLK